MSSLKSMLPTAPFSIGNSRSSTGSTLTEESCESDRSTLSGSCGLVLGASALARDAPSPDFAPSPECHVQQTTAATAKSAAAIVAPRRLGVVREAIAKPHPVSLGLLRHGHRPSPWSTVINHRTGINRTMPHDS